MTQTITRTIIANEQGLNRDPLSGTPGAHPSGTGAGAASGGVAGAAVARQWVARWAVSSVQPPVPLPAGYRVRAWPKRSIQQQNKFSTMARRSEAFRLETPANWRSLIYFVACRIILMCPSARSGDIYK